MVRKNIFELLINQYDVAKEMNKISELFENIKILCGYYPTACYIEEIFEKQIFPKWKQRGCYLSCSEMREALNIPYLFVMKDEADILNRLEYYVNILISLDKRLNIKQNIPNFQCPAEYYMLCNNIDILLEHLNYEKQIFEDKEKVILVPKNPASTAVAEIAPKEIAFAIFKYNHASLKRDLVGKKQLLLSIANEYEPLLKKPVDGFKDYFDKTNALLNNLHLRHNNKTGKNKNETVANMPPEELESWYDELYQLLLFCVLCKDNYERKGKVSEILKNLKTELKAK